MPSRLIADSTGLFSCEIEVSGTVLIDVLDGQDTDALLHAALTTVLAAVAQGPPWPERVLDSLTGVMAAMRDAVLTEDVC